MTIVKASYTTGARGPAATCAAVRYAATRRDLEGQTGRRRVFGLTDELTLDAAQLQLGDAVGSHHYRLVLNPGAGHHHVDQQAWTRDVMATLAERRSHDIPWVAVEHLDHSAHDHVHVVAVIDGALDRRDLEALRAAADASWERHAAWTRVLDLDHVQVRVNPAPERTPALDHSGEWER